MSLINYITKFKAMFLDDQLIEVCKDAEINEPDDVQQTYNDLIDVCQDYYKKQIFPGMKRPEVKIILDRTFKLWESFVRMALESENAQVVTLGSLYEKYSFKNTFLKDERLEQFYNTL